MLTPLEDIEGLTVLRSVDFDEVAARGVELDLTPLHRRLEVLLLEASPEIVVVVEVV